MAIDKEAIREHIRGILIALGDDPDREGLKETPDRVARMYEEVFEGMNYSNHEIAEMFNKSFQDDLSVGPDRKDIVLVRDIPIFSYCEHHIALMYDMHISVAYIPNGRVLGLSKIAGTYRLRCGGNYDRGRRHRRCSGHHPWHSQLYERPGHKKRRRIHRNHHPAGTV